MTAPSAPCCFIGVRSDVDAINAAFAAGSSVGEVLRLFPDLSRGSIGRHRSRCLGLAGLLGNDPGTDAGTPGNTPGTTGNKSRRAPPIRRPTLIAPNDTSAGNVPGTTGERSNVVPFRRTIRLSEARGLASKDAHVDFLARLIEGDRFRFRPTLDWLASAWGIPDHEVRDRYREAVQRVSADKQIECAEKEVNLAALETKEAAAMREFRRLRKSEPTTAKGYLQLAVKCRTEYADLAGLRRTQLDVNMNIWQRPEFVMAVDTVVETSLSACLPEAASEFDALVREAEKKLGAKVDPAVAAAVLEVASRRVAEKLGMQARGEMSSEPAAAE